MRKILYSLILITITFNCNAQTFYHAGYALEFGNEIEQTTDGGFILCGETFDSLLQDTYKGLLKIDSLGHVQWHKEYVSGHSSLFYSVEQTTDGGYIATGNVGSHAPNTDSIAVIKTDASGNIQWSKSFGNLVSHNFPSFIRQTFDSNYAVVGMDNYLNDSRIGFYQVDQNGNLIRAVFYKDPLLFSHGLPLDFIQLSDSGFLISGKSTIGGGGFAIKTDSIGNVLWSKTYGSNQILVNDVSIQQTNDNGFVFAFSALGYNSLIVKTDFNGDTLWTRNVNGTKPVTAHSIIQLPDSDYLITGSFGNSAIDTLDIFILKLDTTGNTVWSKCIQHQGIDNINAYQVLYNNDNTLSFLSSRSYMAGMIKTDTTASSICNTYQGNIFLNSIPVDVVVNSIAQFTGGTSTPLPSMTQNANTNYSMDCITAAAYVPMLDSVNVWTYVANYFAVSPPPHLVQVIDCSYPNFIYSNASHVTGEDTIVHSILYKKLYYNNDFSQCLFGFIREDTSQRKVYFQDVWDSAEVVLYDFSMLVGDSISIDFISGLGAYWPSGTYRLDSITNISINAVSRNAYHLNCISQLSNHTLTWIEGIGNLADLVYPYSSNFGDGMFALIGCPEFPHDFTQFMTCFEHTNKVYFDSCAYQLAVSNFCFNVLDSCNYWDICGDVNEISAVDELRIFPNPVQDKFTIYNPLPLSLGTTNGNAGDVSIYNVMGEKIYSDFYREALTVNCEMLSSGIYFLEVRTDSKIFKGKFVKQ
jgi:hypothetical protein